MSLDEHFATFRNIVLTARWMSSSLNPCLITLRDCFFFGLIWPYFRYLIHWKQPQSSNRQRVPFPLKVILPNKETVPAIRVAPVGRQPGGQSVMSAAAYFYVSSALFFKPLFWKHQYRRLILSLIYLNNHLALINGEIKLFESLIKYDYKKTYRD